MTEPTAGNHIVVGVDGSDASVAALRWAVRQAHSRRADVIAVHAWEWSGATLAPYAPASSHPGPAEERLRAEQLLAGAVRSSLGPHVDTPVRAVVVEGSPARVLLKHARDAQLLALGRPDHPDQGLPAIGAVTRDCLRHATVPVVTVPVPRRHASPPVPSGTAPLAGRGAA
ncbi:universal stress protein [Streptomyces sp. NPDC014892]|uniref:universal stress protein n=1 Tax=Streptomyces sp. NPDC014892 TaxID=3364930 RepID=UPI0036F7F5BC